MTGALLEATLKETDAGLVPDGEGWFVLNARDARWWQSERLGRSAALEGEPEFSEVGFKSTSCFPASRTACITESRARRTSSCCPASASSSSKGRSNSSKAWDFVHCPPMAEHIFVGAGDGPCVIVMTGRRKESDEIRYPVNDVAAKHDAGVLEETTSAEEAYARFERGELTRYGEGWLP